MSKFEPLFLHRSEAVKLSGLSLSSVDKAIRTGELPAKKYGKRTLIPREGFQRFCETLRAAPPTKPRKKGPRATSL